MGEPTLTIRSRWERTDGVQPGRVLEHAELAVPMTGALAGRTCVIHFHLVDGRVHVGDVVYRADEPQPLGQATNRALKDLRLGDVPATAEACLRNMATVGAGVEWLQAFEATRRRAGRAGISPQTWALVAARRIEAEQQAPGKAIRYMRRRWPDMFVSDSATSAKVNKAIRHGMLEHSPDGLRLTDHARQYLTPEDHT